MWTDEEVLYLEKYAGARPVKSLARKLNRSVMSVRHKLYSLGYGSETELDCFTTGFIAGMLGCTSSAINKRILKGDLRCRKKRGTRSYIFRGDFKNFYEANKTSRLFSGVPIENIEYLITGGQYAGND